MATGDTPAVGRRTFLKTAAVASAGALSAPAVASAQSASAAAPAPVRATPVMTAAAEAATPDVEVLTADRTGSDFMVDVIKSFGIDYVCANPGSSFRGFSRVRDQLRRQPES